MKTIDITPSWHAAANIIALVLENGNAKGKSDARADLLRMAELADKWAEHVKATQKTGETPCTTTR